jgi:hypothetical protein
VVPIAKAVPAITQGRAELLLVTMAAPASSGAPRKLSMKAGFTIATFMFCMVATKLRSSPRARPGITPLAQV